MSNRIWQNDGKSGFAIAEPMARTYVRTNGTDERLSRHGKTRQVPNAPTPVDNEISPLHVAAGELAERRRALRSDRLAEIQFLHDQGLSQYEAVEALGWSLQAAAIAARRAGHPLASWLGRAARREYHHD